MCVYNTLEEVKLSRSEVAPVGGASNTKLRVSNETNCSPHSLPPSDEGTTLYLERGSRSGIFQEPPPLGSPYTVGGTGPVIGLPREAGGTIRS